MYDILIIGGGLAGLTASIHLSQKGKNVILIEKKSFPQHKVCGEYVSNEILQYLQNLGADPLTIGANPVQKFQLFAPSGKVVEAQLPLGGFGIRRYTFDEFLFEKAKENGVTVLEKTTVTEIDFEDNRFKINCQKGASFQAKIVLGSFGKRSNLDKTLNRNFFSQPTDYLGVKHFFEGDFPQDLVALYNFPGGYCGAIQVEDKSISVAYLTRHQYLKKYGNLQKMEEALLYKNPILKRLFTKNKSLLKRPQTISNVSFQHKEIVQNHVLMIGDAAGMIAPVCGNGMAMGIHGAKIASELVLQFLEGKIDRTILEQNFTKQWKNAFGQRVFWGRQIQKFMGQPQLSEFAVKTLHTMPLIFPTIIKKTHGKPVF